MVTAPIALRIRMYNVGFGDAFLVTFRYAASVPNADDPADQRSVRHILFDCGSTSRSKARWTSANVVDAIVEDCEGRLDAIVISHRHRDHLSAFGGDATGPKLAALRPRLVVRAWTEEPALAADAGQAPEAGNGAAAALAGAAPAPADAPAGTGAHGADDLAYLARIARVSGLTGGVLERALAVGKAGDSDLEELSRDQMPNGDAVDLLRGLAGEHGERGEYLFADQPTRLATIVPGVGFRVLGPPKPAQWPGVVTQADGGDEFWLASEGQVERLFDSPADAGDLGPLGTTRWLTERLRRDEPEQVEGLVRWLDDALNNTSVILLIEVPGHRLLFGGDAQVESWGWALDQATRRQDLADALAAVDLYKVGHHGSRNATPKSLHARWAGRPPAPFMSLMSTKLGVHGEEHEVPRDALVTALRTLGPLVSTDEVEALWVEVAADLPGGAYVVSEGP